MFSRNPISGKIEAYTGEGEYEGHVFTMFDFIQDKMKAQDGGPGSGNWGHRGRPGKVGGSSKGSGGGAFRAGNKESGYRSFARSEEFKGILDHARKSANKQKFLNDMPEEFQRALEAQYDEVNPEEDFYEYAYRMYDMLTADKPKEKSRIDGWRERLLPDDRGRIDSLLERYDTLAKAIQRGGGMDERRQNLDAIAKTMDWDQRLLDRNFEGLTEEEEKNLNWLLDKFPWNDAPEYAKIPNEDILYNGVNTSIMSYYNALKAKAIGIPDVDMPEVPENLTYAMTTGTPKEQMASKDGGYVHTPAGDKNRADIKMKLSGGQCLSMNFTGIPDDVAYGYKQQIINSVDQMDDRMADLVNKTIGKSSVQWNATAGRSNYLAGDITMYTKKGDKFRSPEDIARTFWHEYGHYVDDPIYSESGITYKRNPLYDPWNTSYGATNFATEDEEYHNAARKDIENLLEMAGLSDKYGVAERVPGDSPKLRLIRKSDGAVLWFNSPDVAEDVFEITQKIDKPFKDFLGYNKYLNFMQEHGAPTQPEFKDYFVHYTTPKKKIPKTKEKYKGAEADFIEANKKFQSDWDKWVESIGGQDAYFELAHERDRLWEEYDKRQATFGNITDCLDDAVDGLFGFGAIWGAHDFDYYRGKGGRPIETAANVFMLRSMNEKDQIDFMNKFMPNIAAVMTKAWRCGT